MANLNVTPVPEKLTQLRHELNWTYGYKVWMYTINGTGNTITLHGYEVGTLNDIARALKRDGLVV
jgi:hypothetical protein